MHHRPFPHEVQGASGERPLQDAERGNVDGRLELAITSNSHKVTLRQRKFRMRVNPLEGRYKPLHAAYGSLELDARSGSQSCCESGQEKVL